MPTTYAHWRFGNDAINLLSEKYQLIIKKYRDEFNIGVQGPDALYYYNCIKPNEINALGYAMHKKPFSQTIKDLKENALKSECYEGSLSYLMGFFCHFVLDSYCHSYIERKKEVTGPSHNKIESQFDRYLIEKDGYNPIKFYPSTKLNPVYGCCHNIARIYTMFPEEKIQKALTDMVFYLRVIRDSNFIKRKFMTSLLTNVGQSAYVDLMLGTKNLDICKDSNLRLMKLYNKALEHLPILFDDFCQYMEKDKELSDYFNHHFEAKTDYINIPILSFIEELNYEVNIQD